jgi:chemotaxis protein methyltransferase CheR
LYFDQPTKTQVLERMTRAMPQDGYLFLGVAETIIGITEKFQSVAEQRGIYCPAPMANPKTQKLAAS